ncbi:MAG: erythromycin esterase family protein [Bacteroidia bacterium]
MKDKSVIGLGEATHGTHEFFKYKDRLIRFLVTDLNFKAIAFESDFVTLLNLNGYINGKMDKMVFSGGFPATSETKEMLAWLKKYNQTKADDKKVQIYGLETRGFNNITKLLLNSLPNLTEANRKLLLKFENTSFNLLAKKDVEELKLIVPVLYRSAVDEGSSLHKFYVRLLEQEILEYFTKSYGIRDNHMSENVSWIYEDTSNKKLIIWAHNGHLAKSNIFKQAPLGKQLYQKYGDKYYVIATDFNHGEVGVFVQRDKEWLYQNVYYPEVINKDGYEFFFSKCKFNNFFIDIKEASREDVLNQFLYKKREMRSIGGTEKPANSKLSISSCFDLVAFFNKTTATK